MDSIVLILGILLTIGLLYTSYEIKSKTSTLKNRGKRIPIDKKEELILKYLSNHFDQIAIHNHILNRRDFDVLKPVFEKQLEQQLFNKLILKSFTSHSFVFEKHLEYVYFEKSIIDTLQKERQKDLLLEISVNLYKDIAKFIVLTSYIRRKENQINLDVYDYSFKLPQYNFRLLENKKGIEKIIVG